jgi:hypothetical protein|nr:MAG TPA: hypothetical protein [Caudoviricetes sp.]
MNENIYFPLSGAGGGGSGSGGKYSNHLQYQLTFAGAWDTNKKIFRYDEATTTSVNTVLDKLDELLNSSNYDYIINVKATGVDGGSIIPVINVKATFVPNAIAVRNLQVILVNGSLTGELLTICIENNKLETNSEQLEGLLEVFTFIIDINY